MVGKRINGYEIIRVLGRGGMGVVYKAHEMTLQRVVALKVLPGHLAENKEFIERFYREARAAARLNHPNVVTIHRVGEDDGFHYIAMEFLKGKEVTDLIKERGYLPVQEALDITRQVASALAAAHEMGIMHRDIKPQNIMIDEAGRVKVMDFGIARMSEAGGGAGLTMTGQLLGTPAYMSPEQCMGTNSDHRSDIYSLGVAFYQMLAGRVPFSGDTPLAVIRKIVEDELPEIYAFRQDVPDDVVRILHKTLAKDVDARYQSAAELEEDIKRFQSGQKVHAVASFIPSGTTAAMDSEGATMVGGVAPLGRAGETQGMSQTREIRRSGGSRAPLYFMGVAVLLVVAAGGFSLAKKRGMIGGTRGGTEVAGGGDGGGAVAGSATPGPEGAAAGTTPAATETSAAGVPAASAGTVEVPVVAEATPTPKPNEPPEAKIVLSSKEIDEGDTLRVEFVYSDPEGDSMSLAYAVDNKTSFRNAASDSVELDTLKVGDHTIYLRVRDDRGGESLAEASVKVNKAKVVAVATPRPEPPPATPARTPMEVAVNKPADTPRVTPMKTPARTPEPAPATPPPSTPPPSSGPSAGQGFLYVVGQHQKTVKAVAFAPDGKRVVSASEDGKAVVWDLASQKQVVELSGHKGFVTAAAFSPSGDKILTGGQDSTVIVWDSKGTKLQTFSGHPKGDIVSVGFSSDGSLALSASKDGTVCQWEAGTTSERKRFTVGGGLNAAAFSRDGRSALTAGAEDKTIRLWDVAAGTETRKFESGLKLPVAILSLAFSPDGRMAASGGQDKLVWLWDVASGQPDRKLSGHEGWVTAVAFSPNGRYLMSGDREALVVLWDAETGTSLEEFRNHTKTVMSVAFSPDSSRAITGSGDMTVRAFGMPE